jgi:hypothetical protein
MMQMIRTSNAVLLGASKTELAPPTDPAREPDADQPTHFQSGTMLDIRAKRDNSADSFVAADVGELDLCYGVTVWSGRGAGFGVQVCRL